MTFNQLLAVMAAAALLAGLALALSYFRMAQKEKRGGKHFADYRAIGWLYLVLWVGKAVELGSKFSLIA